MEDKILRPAFVSIDSVLNTLMQNVDLRCLDVEADAEVRSCKSKNQKPHSYCVEPGSFITNSNIPVANLLRFRDIRSGT